MSLILHKKLSADCSIGLWKIEENRKAMLQILKPSVEELIQLESIKNEKRQLQWMASRLLLNVLTGAKRVIYYDSFGKPFISGSEISISIAHSQEYVAVITDTKSTGIDIEEIAPKVERIKHKFLSPQELEAIPEQALNEYLIMYWCAKECLYKAYGKKSLIFKENIKINPFRITGSTGELSGCVRKGDFFQNYYLCYEKIQNYMLVYVSNP